MPLNPKQPEKHAGESSLSPTFQGEKTLSLDIEIFEIRKSHCSLTGKQGEGVVVSIGEEPECFLSWLGLRQMIGFKTTLGNKQASDDGPVAETETEEADK